MTGQPNSPAARPLFTPAGEQYTDTSLEFIGAAKRRQLDRKAEAELEEQGQSGDLYWRGVELNHTAMNMMQLSAIHGQPIDETWDLDPEQLASDFKELGLPTEWMVEFGDTTSEASYQNRLRVFQERHQHSQVLMAAGGRGFGAMLASSVSDPITFALEAATVPFAVAGKGNKIRKFAHAALYGGAIGASSGALQSAVDPDYNWKNLLVDAAAGSTLEVLLAARPILRSRDEAIELQRGVHAFADVQGSPTPDLSDIDTIRSGITKDVDDEFAKAREELLPIAGERPDSRVRESTDAELTATQAELEDAESFLRMANDAPDGALDADAVTRWDEYQTAKGELATLRADRASLLQERAGLQKTKEAVAQAKKLDKRIKATETRVTELASAAKKTGKPKGGRLNVRARMIAEDLAQWGDKANTKQLAKMREAAAQQEIAPIRQRVADLKAKREALTAQKERWARAEEANIKLKALEADKSGSLFERASRLPDAAAASLMKRIAAAEKAEKEVLKRTRGNPDAAVYEKANVEAYRRINNEKFAEDSGGAARVAGTRADDGLDTTFNEGGNREARQVVEVAVDEGQSDKLDNFSSTVRIDMAKVINNQPTAEGRALGRLTHSSPVGVKGESSNSAGFVERAKRLSHVFGTQWMPDYNKAYLAWAETQGFGGLTANFRTRARTEFGQSVYRYMAGFEETDPNVLAAAEKIGKGHMTSFLRKAQKAGVEGVQGIDPSVHERGYLPRRLKFDLRNLLDTRLKSSTEANKVIETIYKEALKRGFNAIGRDVDEKLSERVAHHLTEVAFGRKYPAGVKFQGQSKADYLEDVLDEAGLSQEDINDVLFKIVDVKPDAAKASNRFKTRLPMDLTVHAQLPDGTKLYLSDLYEDNVEALWDDYSRELAGHIGIAEVGFRNSRKLEELIDTYHTEGKINDEGLKTYRLMLKSALGMPLEDNAYGTFARASRMVMDWNFLRVMGSVGWSMTAETGKSIAAVGMRATLQQMPAFFQVFKDVATGSLDAPMAREMAAMFAPGTSVTRSSVSLRTDDLNMPGLSGRVLTKVDQVTQSAKRLQVMLSGLGPITDVQQRMFANGWLQRLANEARGKGIDEATRKRLRDYGMDNAVINELAEHLKTGAKYKGSVINSINADVMSPKLLDQYANMMSRAGRHIIQDLDVGHIPRWMHTLHGRLLMQFRTFAVGAYTRALLHGFAMKDAQALAMFAGGFAGASIGYVGRVYANYPHDEQKRKELLAPEKMWANVTNMTAEGAFAVMTFDNLAMLTGNDPIVSQRGTGLTSNFLSGNPTVDLGNDIIRTAMVPGRIVNPDKEMTEEDLKAMVSLMYLNRLPLILGGMNWFVEDAVDAPREYESMNNRK